MATRPWQHVLEPLVGYLMVAEDLFLSGQQSNDAWNFGPQASDIRTVSEVAKLFASEWSVDNIVEEKNKENYHEANILSLDSTKALLKLLLWTSGLLKSFISIPIIFSLLICAYRR